MDVCFAVPEINHTTLLKLCFRCYILYQHMASRTAIIIIQCCLLHIRQCSTSIPGHPTFKVDTFTDTPQHGYIFIIANNSCTYTPTVLASHRWFLIQQSYHLNVFEYPPFHLKVFLNGKQKTIRLAEKQAQKICRQNQKLTPTDDVCAFNIIIDII